MTRRGSGGVGIGAFALRLMALGTLLTAPHAAQAQMPNINLMPEVKSRTPEEIERDDAIDKKYRDSLRKIPNASTSNDPWGDVRGAETARPKAAPKGPDKSAKAAPKAPVKLVPN